MKSSLWMSLAVLGAGSVLAQTPDSRDSERKRGVGRSGFGEFLTRADTDQDGAVSREEFFALERIAGLSADQQNEIFSRLDKDGDGLIRQNDLEAPGRPQDRKGGLPSLRELDVDQDGVISFEEFEKSPFVQRLPEERRRAFFEKLDQNGDGVLSPEDRRRKGPRNAGERGQKWDGQVPFDLVDRNGDGVLDFSEFCAIPVVRGWGEDRQEDRFEALDRNGDQKLNRLEFKGEEFGNKKSQRDLFPREHLKRESGKMTGEREESSSSE
ncbi:MAG: EF-hand domain-containing protein [Verrucomicrobiales bacterium]